MRHESDRVARLVLGGSGLPRVRIDPATDVLGLRVNLWASAAALVAAVAVLAARARPATGGRETPPIAAGDAPESGHLTETAR